MILSALTNGVAKNRKGEIKITRISEGVKMKFLQRKFIIRNCRLFFC